MDPELISFGFNLGLPVLLLLVGYFTGTAIEAGHYRKLRRREKASQGFPTLNFEDVPASWNLLEGELVTGSVVVSIDYFKRFLSSLRMLFGGRIKAYETLLDRARREAIMRVKEQALERGYQAVINLRLETSRLASSRGRNEGTAGVEVLAFGTAVKLAR